ncbi:hypothetical protein EVAR_103928_1 [Eumeta japonica]|uniref:Uncharacterized protein n=1 Tax=Eumeta variegata TaxID=151549 RepID=A0A4C1T394_EUMVA|nr:hypothetical protein EVAR_103928_1 [Eumeta japonica]
MLRPPLFGRVKRMSNALGLFQRVVTEEVGRAGAPYQFGGGHLIKGSCLVTRGRLQLILYQYGSHRSVLPEALQFLDKQPSRNRGGRYNRPVSRDRTRKSAYSHSFIRYDSSKCARAGSAYGRSAAASSFAELAPSSPEVVVCRPTRGTSYHRSFFLQAYVVSGATDEATPTNEENPVTARARDGRATTNRIKFKSPSCAR